MNNKSEATNDNKMTMTAGVNCEVANVSLGHVLAFVKQLPSTLQHSEQFKHSTNPGEISVLPQSVIKLLMLRLKNQSILPNCYCLKVEKLMRLNLKIPWISCHLSYFNLSLSSTC